MLQHCAQRFSEDSSSETQILQIAQRMNLMQIHQRNSLIATIQCQSRQSGSMPDERKERESDELQSANFSDRSCDMDCSALAN